MQLLLTYLITLTIILQTPRPLTIAPLRVFPNRHITTIILRLANFRPKRMRIPLQTILNRPLPVLLILYIIETIHTIAQITKLPIRETITIQLQTL